MEETLKILLVDRDPQSRSIVRQSLDAADIKAEIVETETCAAAIAIIQQQPLDSVLLDHDLPDGDGLSLVRRIKQLGITVPLIVLTGQGDDQIAVELMKAGAADYLSKSKLLPGALVRSLFNAIRVHRAERQAADATQRMRESEERYRLVLEGSHDGIWDWDICQNEVFCNDRLLEIIGVTREAMGTAYEAFYQLMHPDDQQSVLTAITAHLKRGTPFDVEFRLRHASGDYRHCTSRGKAQRDAHNMLSRMTGIVSDITARKQAEGEVVKLNRDLERRVTELQTLFDVIPIGIAIANDAECQDIRVNPTYAEMLGIEPAANASFTAPTGERPAYKLLHNGQELLADALPMQMAAALGSPVLDADVDILRSDGTVINTMGRTTPLFDEQNHPRGCVGAFWDVTMLKRAEATQRFLAEASSVLAASLDYETILHNIAQLAVPTLADCCFFDVLSSQNTFQLLTWQHVDPAKQGWMDRARCHTPTPAQHQHPVVQSLTTGQTVLVPDVTDAWLESIAVNPEHLQFLQDLEIGSLMTIPLIVHDRKLGALTLCLSRSPGRSSGRSYTATDQQLAAALAQRAVLAIDNAQLYSSTQEAEQNLRHALMILGQHQQQLRTLQRLTDLLNQCLTNLPELLQVMVDAICDAIPNAEFGLIVLQNPYTGMLELTAATGIGTDRFQLEDDFAPGEGLLGEIFLTGGSRLIQEAEGRGQRAEGRRQEADGRRQEAEETPWERQEAVETWRREDSESHLPFSPFALPRSLCVVTIESARAGRLGVLAIGHWSHPAAFDDDNLHLLVAFGEQAAIALTNAQLINALEEREERLEIQNRILGEQNRELEEQRQQIQFQNIRLQEAAKLKSQFLATMSHELRTPMNAVIGFSQLLLRQQLMPPQHDMVERILSNGRNLLALINDILDLSKIEAGRLTFALEALNLHQLVTQTVAELRSLVDQKQLTLDLQLYLSNPLVITDRTRLRQVLVNLLSNAIKFTEAGRVCISVTDVEPETIVLVVQDTGVGIAAAQLDYIFEAFYQLDQTLAKKFPGTGLGLAITDLIVRKMNGTITVESELGVGSTFRVTLPRNVDGASNSVSD
ncbi:MAG: PAS domain-containing protein [Tildeniella nuda ZEHNDER 1965/U140]|jgi:PAS domain S-box-containing protein|nr:PAS domain-containing protein [Tildeniella nuda ZEHNDER 1965/U140]